MLFGNERTQPSIDLTHRIPLPNPSRIIDLGCGTGNSTATLRQRWPAARIEGLDSSPTMIEQAKTESPNHDWILADISNWSPKFKYDLIFSNATLQWIPNHDTLLPRLLNHLTDSGLLAVQIPYRINSLVHQLIADVSNGPLWPVDLEQGRSALTNYEIGFYYDTLSPRCAALEIWTTQYIHVMADHEAILQWVSGTGLRPYLDALPSGEWRERFKSAVLDAFKLNFPKQRDGRVLLPFNRLFFIARK